MLITGKTPDEKEPGEKTAEMASQQVEAEAAVKAEPPKLVTDEVNPSALSKPPKQSRTLRRTITILLIAALAGLGYWQRERLLRLMSAKTADHSTQSGEHSAA